MKKKICTLGIMLVLASAAVTGCSGEKKQNDSQTVSAEQAESMLGYSLTYDPSVFTLKETGESDCFTYNTAEKLKAPVYFSVQKYTDMDAQTLAEGLVLQSGMDGIEIQDGCIGEAGIEAKSVYIENEVDGVRQVQLFEVIPMGEDSLLLEILR